MITKKKFGLLFFVLVNKIKALNCALKLGIVKRVKYVRAAYLNGHFLLGRVEIFGLVST
jgi:hypothetical protein